MKENIHVEPYRDKRGQIPFEKWLAGLKDVVGRTRIYKAIDRLSQGNTSSLKSITGYSPLMEIKLEGKGPGYRVYCFYNGEKLIILLGGGDKSSQNKDIRKAWERFNDYQQRRP